MSIEEYLARERRAEGGDRHQLWDGEVFPVVAASAAHERIVRNVLVGLAARLTGRPCEPFGSNLRIRVPIRARYVYADVNVACDPSFEDDEADTLTNPRVVFEVLSPSTERFDRGEKFAGYRSIPSLAEYVLIAQAERAVDHFVRQPEGTWVLHPIAGQGELSLASIDCALDLDAIYEGVLPR